MTCRVELCAFQAENTLWHIVFLGLQDEMTDLERLGMQDLWY